MKTPLSPPAPVRSVSLLNCRVDLLQRQEIIDAIVELSQKPQVSHVITGNALMCLEAKKSPALLKILTHAALVTPESTGLAWAINWRFSQSIKKTPGIDMAYALCERMAQKGDAVFFLGGSSGVAAKAGHIISETISHFQLGGYQDGFFQESDIPSIIRKIKACSAKLILVGLGMPRQEFWIDQNKENLPPGVYIGVGGTFDVWAGRIPRAPRLFQNLGLEWLFRLFQEPSRLGRMLKLPFFVALVLFESFFRSKKIT